MKTSKKAVLCVFLIILSVLVSVYAAFQMAWNTQVTLRVDPTGPRSTDLSVCCYPSTIVTGDTTLIRGKLVNATSREGIQGQTISLYYNSSGSSHWTYITSATTASDGTYSHLWAGASALPAGSYAVNATFSGSIDYDPWSSVTDFHVSAVPIGDLCIFGIKLIQVVRDAKALVANKPSAISVNVTSTFPTRIWAEINVTYDFGTKWYLEGGPHGSGVPIDPGKNRIYILGGPVYNETDLIQEAWQTNPMWLMWTGIGFDDKITVKLDPLSKVSEICEDNNVAVTGMKVVDSEKLEILLCFLHFPESPMGNEPYCWGMNPVRGMDQTRRLALDVEKGFLKATFPVADIIFHEEARGWPGVPPIPSIKAEPPEGSEDRDVWKDQQQTLKNWLYENVGKPLADRAEALQCDRAVIFIPDLNQTWWGNALGMLRLRENRIPVFLEWEESTNAVWDPRSRAYDPYHTPHHIAHEIGHTYYLWHPHDLGPPDYEAERYWVVQRMHAWENCSRSFGNHSRTFMSYETENPDWIDFGEWGRLPLWIDNGRYDSNPKELKLLPAGAFFTWSWNLFDQLTFNPHPASPQIGEPLMIRGVILADGTVEADKTWYHFSWLTPDLVPDTTGNYSIVLLDDQLQLLTRFGFNVSYTYFSFLNGTLTEFETDTIPFTLKIPWVEGTKVIEIRNSTDHTLYSRTVTANPPTVDLSFPNGGETLEAGLNYTVTYDASDLDGDTLTYTLACSSDGGESWMPLSFEFTESSYVWNTSYLQKGSQYLVKVIASDGVNTAEDVSDSTFTVKVHDTATTNVAPSKTIVGKGYTLHINATITNEGDFTETFNVTVYANTTVINTLTDITLTSGNSTTITFAWNTTDTAYGDYTIRAHTTPVQYETDIADNTFIDGTVFVTIPGDITGPDGVSDGLVDTYDLRFIVEAYGKTETDPDWDEYKIADITGPNDEPDGKVDIYDQYIISKNYGKTI